MNELQNIENLPHLQFWRWNSAHKEGILRVGITKWYIELRGLLCKLGNDALLIVYFTTPRERSVSDENLL